MGFETIAFRRISKESAEHFNRFDCGRAELNLFLLEDALEYDEHGLTVTTLVYEAENPCPVAFYSLSADAVKLTTFETGELGLPFTTEISFFPAVKITRFAVGREMQRNGLGRHLLNTIQGQVFSSNHAVRLLTVDALNDKDVISFYGNSGFQTSLETENRRKRGNQNGEYETVHMIKDIYAE